MDGPSDHLLTGMILRLAHSIPHEGSMGRKGYVATLTGKVLLGTCIGKCTIHGAYGKWQKNNIEDCASMYCFCSEWFCWWMSVLKLFKDLDGRSPQIPNCKNCCIIEGVHDLWSSPWLLELPFFIDPWVFGLACRYFVYFFLNSYGPLWSSV